MTASRPSAPVDSLLEVRPAVAADHERISNLIYFESYVHRHLDWRAPLDWLGYNPYWVIQEGERLSGALACPPDPDSIAWIRLFAFASHVSGRSAWRLLWSAARQQLAQQGGATGAAIATQPWLDPILIEDGFDLAGNIVLLEWSDARRPQARIPSGISIRPMTRQDLPRVVEVDAAAFEPLWRNSLGALSKAFTQASYASIAEDRSDPVGYQLSTAGSFGTHLARLAVRPEAQRRGMGAALVSDLMAHMPPDGEQRVTVNTQANNAASLALYYRLGFRRTGERYPVYTTEVR
jgi:ribosomal-protein-alanine N-acetyltransferase